MAKHNDLFPSDLVDPSEKDRDWRKKWIEAAHRHYERRAPRYSSGSNPDKAHKFKEWRDYANGEQSIDIYRDKFLSKKKDGKKTTFRNIDWSILKVAPRFKRVVVGMIMDNKHNVKIQSIDPHSVDSKREFKIKLQEFKENQAFLQTIGERTGTKFDSPVEEGLPIPESNADIEVHMNLFFKDEFAVDYKNTLQGVLAFNHF